MAGANWPHATAPETHACLVVTSDAEQRAQVGSFIDRGLRTGAKLLCLADTPATHRHYSDQLHAALASGRSKPGQLVIGHSDETYLAGGRFEPDRMLAHLIDEIDLGVEQGYGEVWMTGDMTWCARALPGADALLEYEQLLNQALPGTVGTALCQYDRRRLSDDLISAARECHHHTVGPQRPARSTEFRVLTDRRGTLRLHGELDLASTDTLTDALDKALLDGATAIVADVEPLSFTDAAGAFALCRPALEGQAVVVVRHPQPTVARVLALLGLDRVEAVRVELKMPT